MSDLHPTGGKESNLETNPPAISSPVFRRRPTTPGQLGRSTSYTSDGDNFSVTTKPHFYQFAAWDNARKKEPIIFDGLQKIVLAITMKLGTYDHPDPKIRDFVRANIDSHIGKWISSITSELLWSGITVAEPLWNYKLGPDGSAQVWIDDFVSYHPTQVNLKLNNNGRLTHGEKVVNSPYLTGVWVPTPPNHKVKASNPSYMGSYIRLPKSKLFYCTLGSDNNNPWGTSLINSILEYHLFKEAFRDMLAVALDRYGTPLVYAVVPNQQTNEAIVEPDGTTRPKWLYEKVNESLSDMRSEVAMVFTQTDKDHPIKLDSLTTGNNFADTFTQAIQMCDENMMIGMGIPNLIMKDKNGGLGSTGAAERQTELFHAYISSLYNLIINEFLSQPILQLIQYNFDPRTNPLAYLPGTLKERPMRWSEMDILTKSIDKLTSLGYISPEEPSDLSHVRDLYHFPNSVVKAPKLAKAITMKNTPKVSSTPKEAVTKVPVTTKAKAKTTSTTKKTPSSTKAKDNDK
jgi:hypothetical protein